MYDNKNLSKEFKATVEETKGVAYGDGYGVVRIHYGC